jgi:hypothetical protein
MCQGPEQTSPEFRRLTTATRIQWLLISRSPLASRTTALVSAYGEFNNTKNNDNDNMQFITPFFQHLTTVQGFVGSVFIITVTLLIYEWFSCKSRAVHQKKLERIQDKAQEFGKEKLRRFLEGHAPRGRFFRAKKLIITVTEEQEQVIKQASKNWKDISDFVREACFVRMVTNPAGSEDPLTPILPESDVKIPRKKRTKAPVEAPVSEGKEEVA